MTETPKTFYCLAPWRWVDDGDMPAWTAPPETVGLFDMRPLASTDVHGFFAIRPISGERPKLDGSAWFGDGSDLRDHRMTAVERDAWRSALGLSRGECPDGAMDTLRDALIWAFERCGDPDGDERFRPPTATQSRHLEFHLGGHSLVWRRRFQGISDPAWPRIQAMLHRDYRTLHTQTQRGRSPHERETPQRVLTDWMAKYRVADHRAFIPADLPIVPPRPKRTSIRDDFTRSDRDLDGDEATYGGVAQGWDWIEFSTHLVICDNRAAATEDSGSQYSSRGLADHAFSSADYRAAVLCRERFAGPVVRYQNAATDTYYDVRWRGTQSVVPNYLRRRVSGSSTNIDTYWGSTSSEYVDVMIEVDGSSIRWTTPGSDRIVTDTEISTGLYAGFSVGYLTGATVATFEAESLEAVVGGPFKQPFRGGFR